MNSAFADWFVEQFGRRTPIMPDKTDLQLWAIVKAGKVAERVLRNRQLWDEQEAAALYAWQAREGDASCA